MEGGLREVFHLVQLVCSTFTSKFHIYCLLRFKGFVRAALEFSVTTYCLGRRVLEALLMLDKFIINWEHWLTLTQLSANSEIILSTFCILMQYWSTVQYTHGDSNTNLAEYTVNSLKQCTTDCVPRKKHHNLPLCTFFFSSCCILVCSCPSVGTQDYFTPNCRLCFCYYDFLYMNSSNMHERRFL